MSGNTKVTRENVRVRDTNIRGLKPHHRYLVTSVLLRINSQWIFLSKYFTLFLAKRVPHLQEDAAFFPEAHTAYLHCMEQTYGRGWVKEQAASTGNQGEKQVLVISSPFV